MDRFARCYALLEDIKEAKGRMTQAMAELTASLDRAEHLTEEIAEELENCDD